MELVAFPVELLVSIIVCLDVRDILRCREVCVFFKTLIDEDVHTQYKIELALAGMEDGPPSALTPSDRLAILRERQEAWKSLTWKARTEYDMRRGGVWELYGGVLAQADGDRTLVCAQLPSVIRGIEEKVWTVEDVGVKIRDFGMDPAQDLLIIIQHHTEGSDLLSRVHLRSLVSGKIHPHAPKGGMLMHKLRPGQYSYTIQTSEDFLGLLIQSFELGESELLIWNWKSGTLRLHLHGEFLPSFAFLTSQYILITTFPDEDPDEEGNFPHTITSRILVVDVDAAPEQPTQLSDLDYLCAFHYPTLSNNFTTIAMSLRSDPGPHWRPNPSLKVPFHISRTDRLFVITMWLTEGHAHVALLSLIPASTFLSAMASLAPGETRREFEWSEWGPRGSRFLVAPSRHTTVWVCYVYGMTFVMVLRSGSQQVIMTLDFNQLDIRRTLCEDDPETETPTENARLVTETTEFRRAGVFLDPVQTSLPYWLRKTRPLGGEGAEGEGHFEAVMLSEDSLIMVSSQSHIRKYRVLTF
ncbi:hypothetical protein L226DRAFT_485162 [Lentinus tigrinus ALCF2SS1-7]|uniref:F-box domain-containing protein n=1 Tax=Lentinus tigrinus ALCF2SS1-6 TaxID=1328759 RepID=A0A5C2SJU4_9APHY|nr:hypothetical protein L227DRAFT_545888 [Lentinus tigrinus ALCF2SS1-6]RPD76044.1 hypothetical protein L226DRAFT_485162 [Lentinus tigrinus ALCF2SS1-7]